jgi:hypothetical protein
MTGNIFYIEPNIIPENLSIYYTAQICLSVFTHTMERAGIARKPRYCCDLYTSGPDRPVDAG